MITCKQRSVYSFINSYSVAARVNVDMEPILKTLQVEELTLDRMPERKSKLIWRDIAKL